MNSISFVSENTKIDQQHPQEALLEEGKDIYFF